MDLSEPEKCQEITKGIKCDILINNGGLSQRESFIDTDFKVCKYMINVNCLGPIAVVKSIVASYMESYESGK